MSITDRWARLSPEKQALVVSRLSEAKRHSSTPKGGPFPQIHPNLQSRYEEFPLSDIQQAYLIGRYDSVELGNISCHCYYEVDVEDLDQVRFEAALQKMIERHEMLRCVVSPDGHQRILPNVPPYRV